MRARNYYVWRNEDEPEEFYVKSYHSKDIDKMMTEIAKFYAFSDCMDGDQTIDEICMNGRHVYYAGWRSDMTYRFIDATTGEVVWENSFPQWDH